MAHEATLMVRHSDGVRVTFEAGAAFGTAESLLPSSALNRFQAKWEVPLADHLENALRPEDLVALGLELADAILGEEVQLALYRVYEWCAARNLRLRLRIWADDPSLARVPWEFLRLRPHPEFLALDPLVSITRYVAASAGRMIEPAGDLRVLVVSADPGTPRHGTLPWAEEEVSGVVSAYDRVATVRGLTHAVPGSLQRALREFRPHLFHFVGHAEERATGCGLVLHGAELKSESFLRAEDLTSWLVETAVQFVVLSACETAGTPEGVAETIVRGGIPACLASQLPLRDSAQLPLVRSVHRAIAGGSSIEQALAEGRQALRGMPGDWGALVLVSSSADGALVRASRPTATQPKAPAHNLPLQTGPIVGRDRERATLHRLMVQEHRRLVTLTGIGGIGKSRLAHQACLDVLASYPEGVWLVPCEGISDAETLMGAIAVAAGLDFGAGAGEEAFAATFAERRLVLWLDGCESLVSNGAVATIEAILAGAPLIACLATSRLRLGLAEEVEVPLAPLPVPEDPEAETAAKTLFVATASRVYLDFRPSAEDDRRIGELCRELEGLPLALVLAANRLRYLSVADLLDMVTQSRLKSLSEGQGDSRGSLLRVVEDSVRLLPQSDFFLLWRICVFAGGFSLTDGLAVCDGDRYEIIDGLGRLRDHSLLQSQTHEGRTRFRVLDTIREYMASAVQDEAMAIERLVARRKHASLFAGHAARLAASMAEEGGWEKASRALWLDIANFRAAVAFAVEHSLFAEIATFARSLARPYFESYLWEDLEPLIAAGHRAAEKTDDPALSASLLGLEGALAARRDRSQECRRLWERRVELCEGLGDRAGQADALIDLGCQAHDEADYVRAAAYLDRALEIAEETGRHELLATIYVIRSVLAQRRQDLPSLLNWAERAEPIAEKGGDPDPLLFVDINLGRVLVAARELERAERAYLRALRVARAGERRFHILGALTGLIEVYDKADRRELADRCLSAVQKLRTEMPPRKRSQIDSRLRKLSYSGTPAALQTLKSLPWKQVVDDLLEFRYTC